MASVEAAGDGRLQKMEVDYSTTVDEKIPQCEQLTKVWQDLFNSLSLSLYFIDFNSNISKSSRSDVSFMSLDEDLFQENKSFMCLPS